jgi:hypothetical protein
VLLIKTPHGNVAHPDELYPNASGMTLRQWIAGLALQGVLAQPYEGSYNERAKEQFGSYEAWQAHLARADAEAAVRTTDALLKALRSRDMGIPASQNNCTNCISKIMTACGTSEPSASHDWVDEIIGLLRVARSQRDTAKQSSRWLSQELAKFKALLLKAMNALATVDQWDDNPGPPFTHEMLRAVREARAEIHAALQLDAPAPSIQEPPAPELKEAEIIVNGRKVKVPYSSFIDYSTACTLAGFHPNTRPTVTWFHPGSGASSLHPDAAFEGGGLLPDNSFPVTACPGLVITVANTNNA